MVVLYIAVQIGAGIKHKHILLDFRVTKRSPVEEVTKPTSQSTCVGALGPGGPIRQLAVDRALHHTGNIHLPLPLKAELKRKQIQLQWPTAAFCVRSSPAQMEG